jgi:hypothetical protein
VKSTPLTWIGISLFVALVGCGDEAPPPPTDSGVADTTVIVDGGRADTGFPSDASTDASVPDALPPTCSGDCDPRLAEACDDAGVCTLSASAPVCETTVGTKAEGASCELVTDCLPGFACFARRGGGVCARVCCPADGSSCGEERCTGSGSLVDGTETEWWSCVGPRTCDVLDASDDCEAGEGCYIVTPAGETDCLRAGEGEGGSDCVNQNDCTAGYFCAGVTGGTCSRICEIGATSGEGSCRPGEGNCQAYPYSPAGSGVCTRDTTSMFR